MDQTGGSLRVRGLQGHLKLVAAAGGNGDTTAVHQSFAAPIHISKPHRDNGWLVVNVASPSPGLLAGDSIRIDVSVRSAARLSLTTPSASRIHTMLEGERATLSQTFRVEKGSMLDVTPEYVIPQANSSYLQKSFINIEDGGRLMWTESLAPGRTARGEVFAFREVRIATDVTWNGRPLLRERYRISPNQSSASALRFRFPQAYYASILCVSAGGKETNETLREISTGFDSANAWVGVSQIAEGAFVAKILAENSPVLREITSAVRKKFYRSCGVPVPDPRRVTGEIVAKDCA